MNRKLIIRTSAAWMPSFLISNVVWCVVTTVCNQLPLHGHVTNWRFLFVHIYYDILCKLSWSNTRAVGQLVPRLRCSWPRPRRWQGPAWSRLGRALYDREQRHKARCACDRLSWATQRQRLRRLATAAASTSTVHFSNTHKLKKLSLIEDRSQTDRVTAYSYTLDMDLWPWPMTLTFNPRWAWVMIHIHANKHKFKGESVRKIEWKQTDRQKDGR